MDKYSDEFDLGRVALDVIHGKKVILASVVIFSAAALAISMLMKPIYSSSAVIMPPQQQSNGLSVALGSLGGLAGGLGGGMKSALDTYVSMLRSRTVTDALIAKYDLKSRYGQSTILYTRSALQQRVNISSEKDGLITITVEDNDPIFAAKLANSYVDQLKLLTKKLAITEGAQRRLFLEEQLKSLKNTLADSEVALKKTQERTGVVLPEGQIKAAIETAATLKAQIAAKEVELISMQSYASEMNPNYVRVKQELSALRSQLSLAVKGNSESNNLSVPSMKLPEAGMEYVRALREVKYNETLFELVAKQYEVAKYDESRSGGSVQVIDEAVPPDYKIKPRRAIIVLAGMISGLLFGILVVVVRARIKDENSAIAAFLSKLKSESNK